VIVGSFTDSHTADWSCLSFIQDEILTAINERLQAVGRSTLPEVEDEQNLQEPALYNGWWDALEAACVDYVDHTSPGTAPPEAYTLETFLTAAGLPYGRRRSIVHPTEAGFTDFEHGPMQADGESDDIIDWWIFEDLQKACCALRWTMRQDGQFDTSGEQQTGISSDYGGGGSMAAAVADAESNSTPKDDVIAGWYVEMWYLPGMYYAALRWRTESDVSLAGGLPDIDVQWDLWIKWTDWSTEEWIKEGQDLVQIASQSIGYTDQPAWPTYSGQPIFEGRTAIAYAQVLKWQFSHDILPAP
jgi:hypothetical protein